jgi:hypothetical protein
VSLTPLFPSGAKKPAKGLSEGIAAADPKAVFFSRLS